MKNFTFLLLVLFSASAFGQSQIQSMFKQKRYTEIIAFAPKTASLGGHDIFCIGQSYIMLKRDAEAVEMFNQAIAKGYKNGEIYFAKGIAESNVRQYQKAVTSFRQALFYLPNRKKVLIELAGCYYKAHELDSALSVYQKIEGNWGTYYPAQLMTCQIIHEQEKYKSGLDCYYSKLPAFKKDKFYYQQALESIMRLEWHHFKDYSKAELAIKNLMATLPDNYEYNMLLMQLYNFTGNYEGAAAQEAYVMEGYKNIKLSNSYYDKGVMIVEQMDTSQYHIEVYRNFQPESDNNILYKAYLFNFDGTRLLGKTKVVVVDETAFVSGYAIDIPFEVNFPCSYKTFKMAMVQALFLPELPTNDTIPQE